MSWIQSKFTDFAAHPAKKLKLDSQDDPKDVTSQTTVGSQRCDVAKLNWKPRVKSDLVVNKKKIEEVESWLLNCKRKPNPSVLLLSGPPGCGKLTTLKVLCSELKINLIEWLPQIVQRKYDPENGEFYQSASSLFEEFVVRATRYTNVLNSMSSRLVVIKDIPNCYVRDPTSFHEFLSKYSSIPNVHLAFILTDVPLARSLFPDHVKNSLNLTSIAFNPIIQRGVKEVLKKLFQNKFPAFVDSISVSCNGDLRNAITTFEFVAKKGSAPSTKTAKSNSKSSSKSDFLDIFHGLGRILYSKRETDGKLVHDPVRVSESFETSPDLFLGMLQENYLHTFSSIHHIALASDSLASAELLLNDFKDSPTSRSLSLAVAASGVMTQNTCPIRKFQQLNKPRKVTNALSEFRSRFSDSNVLLDVAAYGKMIPSFALDNGDLLSRIDSLK